MSAVQAALAQPCAACPFADAHSGQFFSAFGGRLTLSFRTLSADGRTVSLSPSQAALMGALMRRCTPVSFDVLRSATEKFQRDAQRGGEANVLSTQVCYLRRKLASISENFVIANQWGWGFVLRAREVRP